MKAAVTMTLQELAEIVEGKIISGNPEDSFMSISTDSRDLGYMPLFVPLIGEKFDGHDFIAPLASSKKITAFLTMKAVLRDTGVSNGIGAVQCRDTLGALGKLAAAWRSRFAAKIIGVTGTNGKTTTKEIVSAVLSEKYSVHKNIKNYNNEVGVPFTIFGINSSHEYAVVEMGMNHSGELDRLSRMASPDMAIITNVGEGHLEFLGSVENVALAKTEIMNGMKKGSVVFANIDTECFDLIKERAENLGLALVTYGLSSNADFFPDEYHLKEDSVEVVHKGVRYSSPLYGIHNVYNILAGVALGISAEVAPAEIKKALTSFKNVDGRSQIINKDYIVINDTYNSNPLSSRCALVSIREIYPEKRKIAVLSDMKELGAQSEFYHEQIGRYVAECGFDLLFVCGEMSKSYIKGGVRGGIDPSMARSFPDRIQLARDLAVTVRSGDVILVKGSRSTKMEEVVNILVSGD